MLFIVIANVLYANVHIWKIIANKCSDYKRNDKAPYFWNELPLIFPFNLNLMRPQKMGLGNYKYLTCCWVEPGLNAEAQSERSTRCE